MGRRRRREGQVHRKERPGLLWELRGNQGGLRVEAGAGQLTQRSQGVS